MIQYYCTSLFKITHYKSKFRKYRHVAIRECLRYIGWTISLVWSYAWDHEIFFSSKSQNLKIDNFTFKKKSLSEISQNKIKNSWLNLIFFYYNRVKSRRQSTFICCIYSVFYINTDYIWCILILNRKTPLENILLLFL